MKKKLLFLTILFLSVFYGCNQLDFDEEFVSTQGKEIPVDAKFNVSLNTVQCFVEILNKDREEGLKREVQKIQPIVYHGDTLIYLVNYRDNKGWMIISGDKRTSNILAYSDEGAFDLNTVNFGVGIWTDDLAEQIYALKHRETIASDTLSENYTLWNKIEEYRINSQPQLRVAQPPAGGAGTWVLYNVITENLPTITKGPFLQTKWGQGSPWNTCVPAIAYNSTVRCPTGCVAVSGSQMLYYLHNRFEVPAYMYSAGYCTGWSAGSSSYAYQFGFSNANTTTWNAMALTRPLYPYNPTPNTERVAVLMGYVGSSIGMNYSNGGSGASTQNLVNFLSNQGIKCEYVDYNSSKVMTSLSTNNMPVIISAYARRIKHSILGIIQLAYTYADGHSWVCDGYESQQTKYTCYYKWVLGSGTEEPSLGAAPIESLYKTEVSISTTNRLIMNWGYDGSYDSGRYLSDGVIWTANGYDFQWNKEMVINFAKK